MDEDQEKKSVVEEEQASENEDKKKLVVREGVYSDWRRTNSDKIPSHGKNQRRKPRLQNRRKKGRLGRRGRLETVWSCRDLSSILTPLVLARIPRELCQKASSVDEQRSPTIGKVPCMFDLDLALIGAAGLNYKIGMSRRKICVTLCIYYIYIWPCFSSHENVTIDWKRALPFWSLIIALATAGVG